jgi:hypothetical protein
MLQGSHDTDWDRIKPALDPAIHFDAYPDPDPSATFFAFVHSSASLFCFIFLISHQSCSVKILDILDRF